MSNLAIALTPPHSDSCSQIRERRDPLPLPLLLPLPLPLPFLLSSRKNLLLPLLLLLFSLNQPQSPGAPSSARHYAPKVGMHTVNQPALVLAVVLAVALFTF